MGITTFGVPLFNALDRNGNNEYEYEYEGATFDQCYGHAAGTQYHLHTVPGSRCCVTTARYIRNSSGILMLRVGF